MNTNDLTDLKKACNKVGNPELTSICMAIGLALTGLVSQRDEAVNMLKKARKHIHDGLPGSPLGVLHDEIESVIEKCK